MKEKPAKGKRQKVLFLITKGNWGGAQRYVFDLATNLPKQNFEAKVAFGEGEVLEKKLAEQGIKTVRIKSLERNVNIFSDLFAFFSIIRVLRDEKPDVLHLNSSKAGALGALAGRIVRTPHIIFTGHGWAWNEERFFASKAIIAFLHWFTILLAHKTITVADRVKSEVDRLPLTSSKTLTIRNGIDLIDFIPKNEARNRLCFEAREKTWIGTISELHKNKGLDFLIEAFSVVVKKDPAIALMIIGSGEERDRLSELSARLGVKDKVYFLGFVADAPKYLKAFDIFTLTSRTEAFPYTILEAGLAQVPIIASRVGGIPEAVLDGETGILIERGNTDELAEKLLLLLNDSSKAASLGQAMRKRTEEFFSLGKMVERTIAVYS